MTNPIPSLLASASLAAAQAEARGIMRLSLLDWMACGVAGASEPVAKTTRALALDESGAPQATLFGGGQAPARTAALVNGAVSHALDYDDTHFAHIGHPSVAVFPAALAVGERVNAPLPEILEAATFGAEASIRFGVLFGRQHYQQGFHQTATAGAFGACLAAAQLLGLTDAQIQHALALTSTRASGLKSQFGTMGKPFNAGIAASNGAEAALLTSFGATSNPEALVGVNGFLATHHCDGPSTQSEAPYLTSLSHKFHACCHGLHATLEALAKLPKTPPDQVQALEITTHARWLTVCNDPAPGTGLALKFSYKGIVAAALLGHDTAALGTYSDGLCAASDFIALRDRVSVQTDEAVSETEAHLRLVTAQGTYVAHHDLDAPMSLRDRTTRLRAKATALLGATKADRVWAAIESDDRAALVEEM